MNKKIMTLWLAFCLFLLAAPLYALGVPERLVYEVSWSGITVGKAIHEVSAPREGELQLTYSVRSSGWFNSFYPINDRMESLIASGGESSSTWLPQLFRENINAGKTHTSKEARFDQAGLRVATSDLLKHTDKTDSITPRTQDNLSSIYFIRTSDIAPGKTVQMEVFDCKRLWNAEVRALKREEIRTPLGRFKTVMVTTQLSAEGAKPRPDYMTVWLSDDERRLPVRIAIKLKLGEFRATLVGGSYWP